MYHCIQVAVTLGLPLMLHPFLPLISCFFQCLEGLFLFQNPSPFLWVAQFPSPVIWHAQSPPPSYASYNFSTPLESVTDSGCDSFGLSESDTDSVASPSPSKSAYNVNSKSEAPCWSPSCKYLVADHTISFDNKVQLDTLAKEAREFWQYLAT